MIGSIENFFALERAGPVGPYYEVLLALLYRGVLADGGDAIDGGANSGLHTIGMGRALRGKAGRIAAVEPQPDLVAAGNRWLAVEKMQEYVRYAECALGAAPGRAQFYVDLDNTALSGLAPNDENKAAVLEVSVETIDGLSQDLAPRFIKLDLEGGEYFALKGARQTLAKHRPVVAFENGIFGAAEKFGYSPDEVPAFFDQMDYDLMDFTGRRLPSELRRIPKSSFMFVATPKEGAATGRSLDAIAAFWAMAGKLDLAEWKNTVAAVLRAGTSGIEGL